MLQLSPPDTSSNPIDGVLQDRFGRRITYLRLSVTDRCDLRCVYCMSENMRFLPRADLLTLTELDRLCAAFVRRGIRKIRITGGEPLVRRDVMDLFRSLSRHVSSGALDELTVTTNGTQLGKYARELWACGVRRINLSLDSLNAEIYRQITRGGNLAATLRGLDAALEAGLAVKINTVVLKDLNENELEVLILFAHGKDADISLIETMPLGEIGIHRAEQYLPLTVARSRLERTFSLDDISYSTGGPSRYAILRETGRRVGFITPLSHNFCESCNRVRVSATGTLYTCLGQDNAIDLRGPLRSSDGNEAIDRAIDLGMADKPKGHDFVIDRESPRAVIARHMSVTGG